jgi:hypothetical protein
MVQKELHSSKKEVMKVSKAEFNIIKKRRSFLSMPNLSFTPQDFTPFDADDIQDTEVAAAGTSPPRPCALRHFHSASNLRRTTRLEKAEAMAPVAIDNAGILSAMAARSRMGFVKEASSHAERLLIRG